MKNIKSSIYFGLCLLLATLVLSCGGGGGGGGSGSNALEPQITQNTVSLSDIVIYRPSNDEQVVVDTAGISNTFSYTQ